MTHFDATDFIILYTLKGFISTIIVFIIKASILNSL